MNLYAYVGNDPLNATDPSGMAGCGSRAGDGIGQCSVSAGDARDNTHPDYNKGNAPTSTSAAGAGQTGHGNNVGSGATNTDAQETRRRYNDPSRRIPLTRENRPAPGQTEFDSREEAIIAAGHRLADAAETADNLMGELGYDNTDDQLGIIVVRRGDRYLVSPADTNMGRTRRRSGPMDAWIVTRGHQWKYNYGSIFDHSYLEKINPGADEIYELVIGREEHPFLYRVYP